MTCAHCGRQVPDGDFCAACGASQETDRRAARRWHSYAAHPGEHVLRLSVLSSLLPHLDHRRVHDFRWALIAGLVSLAGLYLLGLIAAAVLVAVLLVPLLYLLYIGEAEVYGSMPVATVAVTLGGGAMLGGAVAVGVDGAVGVRSLLPVSGIALLLLVTVGLPLAEEALKLLPAVLLRRREFHHTLDGLSLGVAAGLGFALAQTAVNLSDLVVNLPFRVDPAAWIDTLAGSALLTPLLQATCTGILAASVWQGRRRGWAVVVAGVTAAGGGHVAFALGAQLLLERGPGQTAALIWEAVVVAALVLYTRWLLHRALLEESAEHHVREILCSHCRRRVLAGRFCPACGLAVAASPRTRSAARPPAGAPGQ